MVVTFEIINIFWSIFFPWRAVDPSQGFWDFRCQKAVLQVVNGIEIKIEN
jgi:hypothetical protein